MLFDKNFSNSQIIYNFTAQLLSISTKKNDFILCTDMIADDILLLKLIQSKDEHAFKYLFDLYFVPLCRYAHLYLTDAQEEEELVLDIYMHLWEHSAQINLTLSLKAYLSKRYATGASTSCGIKSLHFRLKKQVTSPTMKLPLRLKWKN